MKYIIYFLHLLDDCEDQLLYVFGEAFNIFQETLLCTLYSDQEKQTFVLCK